MLKHSLGRILAQLWRRKLYSFISILSLTIGLSVFSLIFLHVKWELSYDRGWPDSGHIYRAITKQIDRQQSNANDLIRLADIGQLPVYLAEYIEASTILRNQGVSVEREDGNINVSLRLTNGDFTRLFQPELLMGDLQRTIQEPGLVALEEDTAIRLFGSVANAIDQRLTFLGGRGFTVRNGQATQMQGESLEFEVGAIYRLPRPVSTATEFGALALHGEYSARLSFSTFDNVVTWMKFKPGVAMATVDQSLPNYVDGNFTSVPPETGIKPSDVYDLSLEPLHGIYFYGQTSTNTFFGGDIARVITFSVIGLLVLLAACTNVVSISLAGILERTREVGILKAVGAQRGQLTLQYLGEAQLLTWLALVPTLVLTNMLHPSFARLLSLRSLPEPGLQELLIIIAIAVVLGLLVGLYPALVLARQKPVDSLKGQASTKQAGLLNLRTILVGGQFTCALLLLVGTLALYTQLQVARGQPLGFNQDNLLWLSSAGFTDVPGDDVLINALESVPGVQRAVPIATTPSTTDVSSMSSNSGELVLSTTDENGIPAARRPVGHDHFSFLEIPVLAGREFDAERDFTETQSRENEEASRNAINNRQPGEPAVMPVQRVLLNSVAARALGHDDPEAVVGQRIYARVNAGAFIVLYPLDVIGVVGDNMYYSLRARPGAEYYVYSPGTLGVRIAAALMLRYDDSVEDNIGERVREAWTQVSGAEPASVSFVETRLDAIYNEEKRESILLLICAGMALLLSTIGLYGLVSVAMKTQIKEIGVRKVLGASRTRIIGIFLLRFIKLMLPANLVAWPVAVYFVLQWIQRFPYQMDKAWLLPICLAGSALVLLVTCGTVAGLCYRAAGVRPTRCLRYE